MFLACVRKRQSLNRTYRRPSKAVWPPCFLLLFPLLRHCDAPVTKYFVIELNSIPLLLQLTMKICLLTKSSALHCKHLELCTSTWQYCPFPQSSAVMHPCRLKTRMTCQHSEQNYFCIICDLFLIMGKTVDDQEWRHLAKCATVKASPGFIFSHYGNKICSMTNNVRSAPVKLGQAFSLATAGRKRVPSTHLQSTDNDNQLCIIMTLLFLGQTLCQ